MNNVVFGNNPKLGRHVTPSDLLHFGLGTNAKLGRFIDTFDLPAGHSCPFAKECLSKANKVTGRITDGKNTRYRCYAAMNECTYPNVRRKRWYNFDLLKKDCKTKWDYFNLIWASLPEDSIRIRVHTSGDFFNQNYFDAWMEVARRKPSVSFYAYTKAIPFWVKRKNTIPKNFVLTASLGGTQDSLIQPNKLKSVFVVFSPEEAYKKKLEIDHNDSLAHTGKKSFSILLHGVQPADTKASIAYNKLVRRGIAGYYKNKVNRSKL